ncbi:MAG: GNAT family N-acetyltransferase, partial [Candidatus Bipolaricaulota bacterium]|nr:GNAT family N-acetyltransferase [Candidatus Bipolaricaulota bacterium]
DRTYRGRGLGEFLLMDALHRSLKQTGEIASFAVVVDAVNEDARTFYLHFGFLPFPDREDRLFLPMKTIEKLF